MMFSVLIPAYNRRLLLEQALASVWAQEFKDYEVIVVDDGSTDGTMEMLEAQKREHPNLKVFCQANAGPGAARNRGANEATGEYLAFLDSDDLWLPWTLGTFAEAIRLHDFPAVIGGNFVESEFTDVRQSATQTSFASHGFADYLSSWELPFFVGAGMGVYRREPFLRAGGFVEDRLNAEDHDLMFRLGVEPGFVKVLAPVTLLYRRHAQSETANLASAAAGTLRLIVREKRGEYPGGLARKRERNAILAAHSRPVALACLSSRHVREGMNIYLRTLGWNLADGRWRYLLAFPFLLVARIPYARCRP
jgi:glycosyltransferase involved in cell wall biosynthesis